MAVWSTGTISEIGVVCIIVFELLLTKLAIAQPENKCYSRFSNLKSASLFATVLESPFIPPLKRRLDAGDFLSLNSLAEAGQPFVTALLAEISHRPILVVTAGLKSQEAFFNDLQTFIRRAGRYINSSPLYAVFPTTVWELLQNRMFSDSAEVGELYLLPTDAYTMSRSFERDLLEIRLA